MEFTEFAEKRNRMCSALRKNCHDCGLSYSNNARNLVCYDFMMQYAAEAEQIVAKWAAEHPVKTRQSEFLKMFPSAELREDGCLSLLPCELDTGLSKKCCGEGSCWDCRHEYWLGEVE